MLDIRVPQVVEPDMSQAVLFQQVAEVPCRIGRADDVPELIHANIILKPIFITSFEHLAWEINSVSSGNMYIGIYKNFRQEVSLR